MTTAELLQNRDARLVWVEPWAGLDADGNERTFTVEHTMTVQDAIDCMRQVQFEADHGVLCDRPSMDEDLLMDFMAVHWAVPQSGTATPTP